MNVIADRPTPEMYASGQEIDCQCARCGSSCYWSDCHNCDGDYPGYSYHDCGEDCCCCIDPEPNMRCDVCDGHGGWHQCLSSSEWCNANPVPGRENVPRGKIEWFTYGPPNPSTATREGSG